MKIFTILRDRISRFGANLTWRVFQRIHLSSKYSTTHKYMSYEVGKLGQPEVIERLSDQGGNLNVITHAGLSGVFAAYSFRFVALPWQYFYESMQDLLGLTQGEIVDKLINDYAYRMQTITAFFEKASNTEGKEGVEYLREEMFHHRHLHNTSLWVFSQGLTLLMRFAVAYICFRRTHLIKSERTSVIDEDYKQVVEFMFNAYFTLTYTRILALPVAEGYAHYQEAIDDSRKLDQIKVMYNAKTESAAKEFINLHKIFHKHFDVCLSNEK